MYFQSLKAYAVDMCLLRTQNAQTNIQPSNDFSGVVWHLPTGENKSFKVSVPQVPAKLLQMQCCCLSVYFCRTVDVFFTAESFLTGCPYCISSLLGSACFLSESKWQLFLQPQTEINSNSKAESFVSASLYQVCSRIVTYGCLLQQRSPTGIFSWKGPAQSAPKKRQKCLCMELSYHQTENVNPKLSVLCRRFEKLISWVSM